MSRYPQRSTVTAVAIATAVIIVIIVAVGFILDFINAGITIGGKDRRMFVQIITKTIMLYSETILYN